MILKFISGGVITDKFEGLEKKSQQVIRSVLSNCVVSYVGIQLNF
jgi:hypothetical protein